MGILLGLGAGNATGNEVGASDELPSIGDRVGCIVGSVYRGVVGKSVGYA